MAAQGKPLNGRMSRDRLKILIPIFIVALLLAGAFAYLLLKKGPIEELVYSPDLEAPQDFLMIVDYPSTAEEQFAISTLTSLQFINGQYHPLVVCSPEGGLSRQLIFTLTHLKNDKPKLLFTNKDKSFERINSELSSSGLSPISEENVHELTTGICARFMGFKGLLPVSSYEESLWAAVYAKRASLAMVEGGASFKSQEEVWSLLEGLGIKAGYVVVANPYDHSAASLANNTLDYDTYDDAFFCPDLSLMAAQVSAYHDAYVITNTTPMDNVEWEMDMGLSPNRRAAGVLDKVRQVNAEHGPIEYIALAGSAPAISQFLMPGPGEGELVNSDVMYGFLDSDSSNMDASIGRIIQYETSLASNQLLKTYLFNDFSDTVTAEYRDVAGGTHEKQWRTHGASFSGYDITYKRMQATPARWVCKDYEDAGFTYDYVGPFGTGNKLADGVVNSMENDLGEICEASGYVAYRGHGSDTGSLYGIRVYGPNGEEYQLRYDRAASLDLPPQVSFFVSCLNGKIYGHGPGTDPSNDVKFDSLFTLNYLSAGPAVLIGATEVSFSNIGQDLYSIPAEYLPFIDDHKWDHNDAWFAFVWDGILNHPAEHGTAGKAVLWSENRYMKYPPNNAPTPFEPTGEVDWYEVTFFCCYGDPSFRPAIDENSQPDYDPWHNGAEDN